jgi:hypothetical protein
MSEHNSARDLDPAETRDWLESIDSVLRIHGPERAHFLLDRLIDHTRRSGGYLPYSPNTAYLNTISVGHQDPYPGDLAVEKRILAYIRWNAMATVVQANRRTSELGGHIATYASSAVLYEVGFNHFWRQGHSAPGIYARAFLEGRISEDQLYSFRQEVDGDGLSSYPHPWLMPNFWQFPTVSMGLGPIMAIYQARFMRYLSDRGAGQHRGSQGLGLPRRRRDGRARVLGAISLAGPRAPRQPGLRRQLQPAAPRRPGARQRQDHPGAGGGLPRRRLERHQGHLGQLLGPAARPRHQGPAAQAHGRMRRRRLPGLQGQGRPTSASTSSASTRNSPTWSPT